MGPGSAEQREGRCTASGTRAEFALAAFLHQTRLINLRRGHSVPRISSAARSGALLSRGPSRSVDMGPGSAEQREERCTASGTRAEFALAAFLHQTRLINLRRGHSVPRISSAARSGALLSRGPSRSVDMGPGSAEQREERCTASGTRAEFALAAFLHQTRLINIRRGHSVPRTQRSAQRCAAEPGSISQRRYGSRLCGAARKALHRVRDTSEMCSHRIPSSDTSDKPPAGPQRSPDAAQRAALAAWCAADPGSIVPLALLWVPALRGSAKSAAPRPGHEWNLLSRPCGDLPVGHFCVEPPLQKYFASPVGQIISTNSRHPTPQEGRIMIVTNAGWVAVDAAAFCAQWDRRAGRKACERSTSGRARDVAADGKIVWA